VGRNDFGVPHGTTNRIFKKFVRIFWDLTFSREKFSFQATYSFTAPHADTPIIHSEFIANGISSFRIDQGLLIWDGLLSLLVGGFVWTTESNELKVSRNRNTSALHVLTIIV
jgi:hypothetical protein